MLTNVDHALALSQALLSRIAQASTPRDGIRAALDGLVHFGCTAAALVTTDSHIDPITAGDGEAIQPFLPLLRKMTAEAKWSALAAIEQVKTYPVQDGGGVVAVVCLLGAPKYADQWKDAIESAFRLLMRQAALEAKLSNALKGQAEFTRLVSHDFRTPLTVIKGYANLMQSGAYGDVSARQGELLDKIINAIDQMAFLVENIQDAGRFDPETGFYVMQREPVNLVEIFEKVVQDYLLPAEKQDIQLSHSVAADVPILQADRTMLERALTNLVDNAIKYTPNGGKVTVLAERRGDDVIISVRDTGNGISVEEQRRLFQRHVRLNRAEHKRVKGSGLGLFIVRSVAQKHGGKAWVESEPGKGSAFMLSLPLKG